MFQRFKLFSKLAFNIKFTTTALSLFSLFFLVLPLSTTADTSAAVTQALFYYNNRQLATIEITKSENTKADVNGLFLGIELEQSRSPSKSSHT
jgi:2-keto-3-deoxy-galactonokinase